MVHKQTGAWHHPLPPTLCELTAILVPDGSEWCQSEPDLRTWRCSEPDWETAETEQIMWTEHVPPPVRFSSHSSRYRREHNQEVPWTDRHNKTFQNNTVGFNAQRIQCKMYVKLKVVKTNVLYIHIFDFMNQTFYFLCSHVCSHSCSWIKLFLS